ncbi:MAG: hypothetical protein ACT4QC_08110 [Planctomycetaceae bacterium]
MLRRKKADATSLPPRVGNETISLDGLAGESVDRGLINRKIIEQAWRARGVDVSEHEIDNEITQIAAKFSVPVDVWLKSLQAVDRQTAVEGRQNHGEV